MNVSHKKRQEAENEYDIETTIVVRGLPFHEGEDIVEKDIDMLRLGLGFRDTPIVRAKRMRGSNGKPGIVKMQMCSLEDKKKDSAAEKGVEKCSKLQTCFLEDLHFTHRKNHGYEL